MDFPEVKKRKDDKALTDERIKELDQQNFNILRTNSKVVERQEYEDKSDEEIEEIYFKEIVQTRNYYSHFKLDKTGVLKASQMNPTINALKAIILSIFCEKMGMEKGKEEEKMEELLEILNEIDDSIDYENETALIDDQLLDSFAIITLVSELEDAFDISIEASEMMPVNFNSAKAIWAMVQRLQED